MKKLLKSYYSVGIENLSSNVDTVVANINNSQSLVDMCARTKLLINCVGPVCKCEDDFTLKTYSLVSLVW
jgi:short subunit dehydrogenase-like uncharacterized protein